MSEPSDTVGGLGTALTHFAIIGIEEFVGGLFDFAAHLSQNVNDLAQLAIVWTALHQRGDDKPFGHFDDGSLFGHQCGGRLAPQGARCGLTRTPIDQPCLSLDLSTARERLAVRLCLADACDTRRA